MFSDRSYRIPDVCKITGFCRTTIYAAIKNGDLTARKYGRCTVVLAADLDRFLNKLPTKHDTDATQGGEGRRR